VAQKSKPLPNDQKIVLNRIKACQWDYINNQTKVWIKHYNIIPRYYIFCAWPTFWPQ